MRQKSFFDASLKNNPCASEVQFRVIIPKWKKKKLDSIMLGQFNYCADLLGTPDIREK